uniref:Uncharacterized protein n=1 Tax=viral metagenome TaxID=1070528 RepID=A0A6M3LW94_9ZZZZ
MGNQLDGNLPELLISLANDIEEKMSARLLKPKGLRRSSEDGAIAKMLFVKYAYLLYGYMESPFEISEHSLGRLLGVNHSSINQYKKALEGKVKTYKKARVVDLYLYSKYMKFMERIKMELVRKRDNLQKQIDKL